LELDIAFTAEKAQELSNAIVNYGNTAILQLRRLFLVEDFVDSAKFGAFLYFLTYIGGWFNGLTLIILGMNQNQKYSSMKLSILINMKYGCLQDSLLCSHCRKSTRPTKLSLISTSTLSGERLQRLMLSKYHIFYWRIYLTVTAVLMLISTVNLKRVTAAVPFLKKDKAQ